MSWRRSDPWHSWYGTWSRDEPRQAPREGFGVRECCGGALRQPSPESAEDEMKQGNLPSGKVQSVHEKADKEEERKGAGKISSSYPPVFKARQGESYREWKRAVKFWLRGEGNALPYHLVGPRVMVQLRERAAQLVKHLEPEDVDGKDGLDRIFEALEKSPLVKQSEKHRVDWHRKRLLTLSRLSGESLESYITRGGLYRAQLEGLDEALSMGERFYVGHLLDHARLSRRDKAMIKTHAGDEKEDSIVGAMMELASELEGESGYPIGRSESQLSGSQGEEHLIQRGVVGHAFGNHKKDKAALLAELNEMETATMHSALEPLAEEHLGEESIDEAEGLVPADVLHAEHEALALQYKAKQKMAEVKRLRHFYNKKDGDGRRGGPKKCFVCDEPGHMARDCPKVQMGHQTQNAVLAAVSQTQTKSDEEWSTLAALCKDHLRDASEVKEVYMVHSSLGHGNGGSPQSFSTDVVPHEAWWNMKELAKRVILDLGCMRNVVGVQWANDIVEAWQKNDRWFRVLQEQEVFRFGDGNTLRSQYRLQLEATFGGRKVLLAFSVVPGPCPPLLSKQSHTKLGVRLDTEHHTMSSRKLKVQNYGLTETDAGHYTVKIDEFHLLENDEDSWKVDGPKMDIGEEVALFNVIPPAEAFGSTLADSHRDLSILHGLGGGQPSQLQDMRKSQSSDCSLPRDVRRRLSEGDDSRGDATGSRRGCQGGGSTVGGQETTPKEHGGGSGCGGAEDKSTKGSQQVEGQSTGCGFHGVAGVHGCGIARLGSRGGGYDHEAQGQEGCHVSEEATKGGVDRMGSRLPVPVELLERGAGLQCGEEHRKPAENFHVEEASVAASGEGGCDDRVQGQGGLEEKPQVAELPAELRDCSAVGPLRLDEAEVAQHGLLDPVAAEETKSVRPQRGLTQKMKKGVAEARQHHERILKLNKERTYHVVLEIFAGCARLSERASMRTGWRVMDPIDLTLGHDLLNPHTQKKVLELVREVKPDLVTLSPRCGPWSQFQHINPNIDKVMVNREEDIPLWRFCRQIWDEQDSGSRLVLMENPAQSEAWNLDVMRSRPNLHRAKIPQCAFGLRDVISGKPHQKYTMLDVNDKAMRDALMEGAVCDHLPGEHQPIEGTVMFEGRSQKRSALAAKWPRELCDHMLKAAEKAWLRCDQWEVSKLAEGREPGGQRYVLPVEAVATPEGELRRQLEKADWRGGQYDYVYYEGSSRQGPYKVRQALAHLHVVLGHPSQERLLRMLHVSGCNNVVINTANGLKCQICEAVRPPGAEPKISGQRATRFGEKVLSDSFYVWDKAGERFNVTHVLDALTEYHVGTVSKNPNAETTLDLLQNKWCSIFGPPELLQTDGGREYADVVHRLSCLLDFRHEIVPPAAKWRQGQVERHGAVVKLMMMRVIDTQQLKGLEEVKMAAVACFNAKNRLCNRMGMSPMQAVTGKNVVLPMSIMDQICSGQVRQTLNQQLDVRDALRRADRIRASAVDSFNWVDSNEAIRKGLHTRSRPPKMETIQEGTTVYVYEPPPHRRGQPKRLQDHSSWDGPALVVCVERQQNVPNRIWVRLRSKVKSFPLEKVRLATPDEMLGSQFIVQILDEVAQELKEGKLTVEQPGNQQRVRAPPAIRRGSLAQVDEIEEDLLEDIRPPVDQQRLKQLKRMEALNDVPETIRQALSEPSRSSGSSSVALKRHLDDDERQELLREEEEMLPAEEDPTGGVSPSRMRFAEKKQWFEDFSKRQRTDPTPLTEARLRGDLNQASAHVRNIKKVIRKGRVEGLQGRSRRMRNERSESSAVLYLEEDEADAEWQDALEEVLWHEAFWNQRNMQEDAVQEIEQKVAGLQEQHVDQAQKAKLVTGKARVEYQWSSLSETWKDAYHDPLIKAVKIYFDHQALKGVPEDQVLDPKRILTTRFVLTNKGGEELSEAVLKARLILGGHKDPDMGRFPTLAPTAALLAHNLINWICVQKRWVVKYEDVSSAFLQGKPLPPEREVYIKLPKGYPNYIVDYIKKQLGAGFRQDVLRLTKGGFGLPESPRLWYLCYKETLCGCGMKELSLLPGVFVAFHPGGQLRALACIHVDDTRYCGDESSDEIWKKVHEKLNFGDLRRSTDGWVKFCGRWEKQDPNTFEFEYSMNEYAKNLQKMNLPKNVNVPKNVPAPKNDMVAAENEVIKNDITPAEKLEMSSTLGQLNWMARQGRYDLSYGVSHVQQMAAKEGREALEWLNKVVYRAKQPTTQVIKKLDCALEEVVIISASDAAFGAQPGGYSQGGMVIALAEPQILEGSAKLCVVEAASMKIQRVVRCSMSAEVSMAATSFEHGDFVRAALSEMLQADFSLRSWKLWSSRWKHLLVIDAKTGFDVLSSETQTSDRKIQIDLAVLKQALLEGTSNSFARWVPGHHMVSDGMTKWYGNGALQKALQEGQWSLRDTEEAVDLRNEASRRRKMYKANRKDPGGDV